MLTETTQQRPPNGASDAKIARVTRDESKPIQVTYSGMPAKEVQTSLRRIDRREWWLWSSAALVILTLMVGIASFGFSDMFSRADMSYSLLLGRAVRGLAILVALFIGHAAYQQVQINSIRRQLMAQVFAVDKVEGLAHEVYSLALLDSLTGSYNRRYAEQRLEAEIARSQRHNLPLTVILFDLDNFKEVNDRYGHAAGDCLLKAFAESLSKSTRGSDVAAHYGGDEFVALLPDCRPDDVQYVLKQLSGLRVDVGGGMLPVSYSAGWANHVHGESSEDLLKRADADLYHNKRASKEHATA
jgi:diguanylate cyclase (GGDEF)-like protein